MPSSYDTVPAATLDAIRQSIAEGVISRRALLRYSALGAATVVTTPAFLSACGGDSSSGATSLEWAVESEPPPLDPHTAPGQIAEVVNHLMYDRLVNRDLFGSYPDKPSPPIVPVLAESFDVSGDAKAFTFRIREGVKFHDGTPLDVAAVRWNFERMGMKDSPNYYEKAGAMMNFLWRWLDGVETPDQRTVVVHMSQPFAELLTMMCEVNGVPAMISPAQVKKVGNEKFGDRPIGTGPYQFASRRQGEAIRFEANSSPWKDGRTPGMSGFVIRPIPDLSARANALRAGDIHGLQWPNADVAEELEGRGFIVLQGDTPAVKYLSLNLREEPMRDVRVRRAINHAIDRESISKDLWKGIVKPWDQMAAPTSGTAASGVEGYPYDPDRAKALLAEAGYPDGFDTVFESWESTSDPTPQVLAEQLSRVGIRVKLQTAEILTYLERWFAGMKRGVGMNIQEWGMNSPWWLNHPFVNFNTGHIEDDEILELLASADSETDEAKRLAIYQQVSKLDVERAYHVPFGINAMPVITSDDVSELKHAKNWYNDLTAATVG